MKHTNPNATELLSTVNWVGALAHSLIRDPELAEDAAQDAWVATLEHRAAPGLPPKAWFRTLVRNFASKRADSERSRRRRERRRDDGREPLPGPDELLERTERQRLVVDAVTRLDEPYRSTVILRYVDGLDAAEIARRQEIPAATVRSRLKRGLEKLRADLDERFGGERETWAVALAALVEEPVPPLPTGATTGPAPGASVPAGATGSLGLTVAVAATVVGLALATWRLTAEREVAGVAAPEAPALTDSRRQLEELGYADDDAPERIPQAPARDTTPTPSRAAPELAVLASANPLPASAANSDRWRLEVDVVGAPPEDVEGAMLRVRSDRNRNAGSAFPFESGLARVDLTDLFLDPDVLIEELHLFLDIDGYAPAQLTLPVGKEERTGGFHLADGVTLQATLELAPVRFPIEGRVSMPDGIEAGEVIVLLTRAPEDLPRWPLLDDTFCDSDGRYRLRAPAAGSYVVVALIEPEMIDEPARRLVPASAPVTVAEGGARADLELVPGAVVEGRVVGTTLDDLTYELIARADAKGAYLERSSMRWNGERFVFGTVQAITDAEGRFVLGGLEPGPTRLRVDDVFCENRAVASDWTSDRDSETCIAPARDVAVRLDDEAVGFLFRDASGPVVDVTCTLHDGVLGQNTVAPSDRFVLFRPRADATLTFTKAGYAPVAFDLTQSELSVGTWIPIELQAIETATLMLEIEGDVDWTAESFRTRVRSIDGLRQNEWDGRAWHLEEMYPEGFGHPLRRTQSGLKVEGLAPGPYLIRVDVSRRHSYEDPTSWIRPVRLAVDLPAGESVRVLTLERGGRILLPRARRWPTEEDPVFALVVDELGRAVPQIAIDAREQGQGWNTDLVSTRRDEVLFPTLAEGTYHVEVWFEKDGNRPPDVAFPVEVVAGELTEPVLALPFDCGCVRVLGDVAD